MENVKSVVFDAETVDVDPTICAVDSELASKMVATVFSSVGQSSIGVVVEIVARIVGVATVSDLQ